MNKQTAIIDDWYFNGIVLFGKISEHPRFPGRVLKDGRTSVVVKMDEANNTCETLNTIYVLGKKIE